MSFAGDETGMVRGVRRVSDHSDVFVSYSHNDLEAAALLHTELESAGLTVLRDEQGIRWSDQWLDRLQEAVSTCKSFVVLIGRDGVRRWINLIHETLIRSKGLDPEGKPQPYWPTLWRYIDQHKERAAWRERLRTDMQTWLEKEKAPGFQWSHERVRELYTIMQRPGPRFELSPIEREFVGPIDPNAMRAELENRETTHNRRALIGERLDVLGDPRWGVGVDANGTPEIAWRPVDAGDVQIEIEQQGRKHVTSFHIGRYPITVDQYQAFLKVQDGWRSAEWWDPDLYRDPEGDTYQVGRFGNNPAVYVSWFDAMAFCRWLGRRLDRSRR